MDNIFFVIVNYNNYHDTVECIESIKRNNSKQYTIVLVDNDSSDKSGEKIKKEFPDVVCILLNYNGGYAKGNNIGVKYAIDNKAKYVCIVNNDVVFPNWFVDKALYIMSQRQDVDIVGPLICNYENPEYIQSAGATINLRKGYGELLHSDELADRVDLGRDVPDYLEGSCFIVRSEVFSKIGFIPEFYFLFFEETDWFFRAREKGVNFTCDLRLRVYHKRSASIKKVNGILQYYMTRNQVIFERKYANRYEFLYFVIYSVCRWIYHLVKKHESGFPFRAFFHGCLFKIPE